MEEIKNHTPKDKEKMMYELAKTVQSKMMLDVGLSFTHKQMCKALIMQPNTAAAIVRDLAEYGFISFMKNKDGSNVMITLLRDNRKENLNKDIEVMRSKATWMNKNINQKIDIIKNISDKY